MRSVLITEEAEAGLVAVGEFIRPKNPKRALEFVEELLNCCAALANAPLVNPIVPRYEQQAVRRCVFQDYLILYRVLDNRIEVLQVIHQERGTKKR